MNVDDHALRAEIDALRAENEALRARNDPATRVWTASDISGMDHQTYLDHEREILAALREGRIVRDPDPDDARTTSQAAAAVVRRTAAR